MNEQLKPFQQVLVRHHSQQEWRVDFYSHKNITTSGGEYSEIIPYEGNETLLGTTDSPQPKRWRANGSETYWCVDSKGACVEFYDMREKIDDDHYEIGNYFRSRAVAQAMAGKFKAMLKGGNE